jgi:L-seryl-tRNA(Ser) seleniumtransferase
MQDRFGNEFAPGLPYARGKLVCTTDDDYRKLQKARRVIRSRLQTHGADSIFNLSGLRRSLPPSEVPPYLLDDELAPAIFGTELGELGLDHMGGDDERHDVLLFNRLTTALLATNIVLVGHGDVVVGLSPTYSHPAVVRSARVRGATFVDTNSVDAFAAALEAHESIALVTITRLAVTYDLLDEATMREAIRLAHERGLPVLVDDASGARVGPAVFGQRTALDLGADLAATGLDKYGTLGPRLGLLAGRRELVATIRSAAFEYGLEARPMLYPSVVASLRAFTPEAVLASARATQEVGERLRRAVGDVVQVSEITAQIPADDLLEVLLDRAGQSAAPIVPYEATAGLAMRLLVGHGVLTVHFAGMPPGTSAVLLKFIDPDELERFGGPQQLASAVDDELTSVAKMLPDPDELRELLFV